MKYRSILLFGAPGSGKGTQGRVLAELPGIFYFASGDAFRALKDDDPLAKKFRNYSNRGELVPDDLTVELCCQHIKSREGDGGFQPENDWLLLDGIPRNPEQVNMMVETIDVRAILHLACPDIEPIVERIIKRAAIEGRQDDANEDVVRNRFATYTRETEPVLEQYDASLRHDINGTQTPIEVCADIMQVLKSLG